MKKILNENSQRLSFEQFKETIDNMIADKTIDRLRLRDDYFDICGNYWLVDKYIACGGAFDESMTPNTIKSYLSATEKGYAICIPVQMLDDESIVCFSHQNISSVCPNDSGYLKKLGLDEVKKLKLNKDGDTVPTLKEALDKIAGKTPIILEIINDGMVEKIEDKVIAHIKDYIAKFDVYEKVAVMSLNPYTLEYFFKTFPYVTRILKSGNFKDKLYGSLKSEKLKKLKYFKITHADAIAYTFDLLPCAKVEKHKPVAILAHSVTSESQYLSVAEHCDNIIFKNFMPTI